MNPTARPHPLAEVGRFLLGAALAWMVVLPPEPVSAPSLAALGPSLALIGGGALFLVGPAAKGVSPWPLLAVGALLLGGLFPATSAAAVRGFTLVGALALGLAAAGDRERRSALVLALSLLGFLGAVAITESFHHRDEVLREIAAAGDARFEEGLPRAFAASARADVSLLNANAYASALLLLLPLALHLARRLRRLWPHLCLLAVGFVLARSFGATLSLLLAIGLPGLRRGGNRWRRAALVLALGGLTVLVAGLGGAVLPGLEHKLQSFSSRVDYWRTGVELLPRAGLFGSGFASFGDLAADATPEGRDWSAHAHQAWLEGLLEAGAFFLVALLCLLRGLRRAEPPREEPAPRRAARDPWILGGLVGTGGAAAIAEWVTPWPLALATPWLSALTAVLLVGGLARWLAIPLPLASRGVHRALLTGIGAFLLHGLVEFAVDVDGVTALFAVTLGIATAGGGEAGPSRVAVQRGVGVVLLFVVPLLGFVAATTREEAQRRLERDPEERLAAWTAGAQATPPLLEEEGAALEVLPPALFDRRLTALGPARVSRIPVRRGALIGLGRQVTADPRRLAAAEAFLAELPPAIGEDGLAHWLRMRIALSRGELDAARTAAREALAARDGVPLPSGLREELEALLR